MTERWFLGKKPDEPSARRTTSCMRQHPVVNASTHARARVRAGGGQGDTRPFFARDIAQHSDVLAFLHRQLVVSPGLKNCSRSRVSRFLCVVRGACVFFCARTAQSNKASAVTTSESGSESESSWADASDFTWPESGSTTLLR